MRKIKVLIAEPSEVVARGIMDILSGQRGIEVSGYLREISRFEERVRELDPDVIIINPAFPFGICGQRSCRDGSLEGRAAVLAFVYGHFSDECLGRYDGVISIYDRPHDILHKLVSVGGRHGGEAIGDDRHELSDREKEILVSVARGLMNKEIADRHNISIHTVITHRKKITRKTGIKTVAGLTIYAIINGLIDMAEAE